MPKTTSTVLTWPTVAEIEAAAGCMAAPDGCSGAYLAIEELTEAFAPLVSLDVAPAITDDTEPLTIETLGALTSTLAKLRFDLEYALGDVRKLELQRDAMALEVKVSGDA